ncbi:hypothetical protein BDZ97DRAFT_1918135 [Flammula alnicola]|nr:hypothetical protein BDZ97DRAFT_1918135 [Flammula alnicola]
MSVATHLSTSRLSSAKEALTSVVEDEDKRASSHTQSLGLLSPIPSFASIISLSPPSTSPSPLTSSSSSSFSSASSSHCHAPRTPRTPLRSATTPKPRPSPLFRLLQPFARTAPVSTPTTPTTSNTSMALHHPIPRPPSPTTTANQSTLSRSERLLRDALMRDEMERRPVPSSPLLSTHTSTSITSPSSKGHKRRHSHVPTSAYSSALASSRSDADPENEEFTRGTFLFRTAMNNPRSPSPLPANVFQSNSTYYGGDAEGSSPMSPVRRHRYQHDQHSQSLAYQQSPDPQSKSRSSSAGSPRSTSHSPSPLRRHRPSHLPLDSTPPPPVPSSSGLMRHNTVHSQDVSESPSNRPRSRPPGLPSHAQPAPGEPLVMTPHEQVLRARLERVLSVGRVVDLTEKEKNRNRRHRERSGSRRNEVRDEEGGWPWRERERERGAVEAAAGGSLTSSPLYSATSNNSGSNSSNQAQQQHAHALAPPSRVSSTTRVLSHSRTRSKTEPASPLPPSALGNGRGSAAPSPRRSSTVPTYPSRIPTRKQSTPPNALAQRTGTTPPLVAGEDAEGEEAEREDGDLRLLTPPPTPPFTARLFSLSGEPAPATRAEGYCPSPYKTLYSPAVKAPLKARTQAKTGLGAPRRPRHAPVDRPPSSSSEHEHEHEQDSSSCSSSQASFPRSDTSSAYAHRQRSRSADAAEMQNPPPSPVAGLRGQRPQFNARKASARCRAMEGYVSFASVEGLGEPPADSMSPDDADLERERGRGVFEAAWGGWKKLLNVAGLEGNHGKDGGVVL